MLSFSTSNPELNESRINFISNSPRMIIHISDTKKGSIFRKPFKNMLEMIYFNVMNPASETSFWPSFERR